MTSDCAVRRCPRRRPGAGYTPDLNSELIERPPRARKQLRWTAAAVWSSYHGRPPPQIAVSARTVGDVTNRTARPRCCAGPASRARLGHRSAHDRGRHPAVNWTASMSNGSAPDPQPMAWPPRSISSCGGVFHDLPTRLASTTALAVNSRIPRGRSSRRRRTPALRVGEQAQDLALHEDVDAMETARCWSVRISSRPVRSPTWRAGHSGGRRSHAGGSCRPWCGRTEPPRLELEHPVGRLLCVQLRHAPVVASCRAHRVAEVDLPVVLFVDVPMAAATPPSPSRVPCRAATCRSAPCADLCSPIRWRRIRAPAHHNHVESWDSISAISLLAFFIMLRLSWSVGRASRRA